MSRLAPIVLALLLLTRCHRRRRRITSISLPLEADSAWNVLWQSQRDDGLVHMTGFDSYTIRIIHHAICPHLYTNRHGRGGRPSRLDTIATTAAGLYYLNSTTPIKTLCQVFACPISTMQRVLIRCLNAMKEYLPSLNEARISWPSATEMEVYAEMVREREPLLTNIFGFVDGVWIPILEPSDSDIQNAYYNGWKSCCNVSNVIVWAPDGCIIWARYNCPGSWHDTNVAEPLLQRLHNQQYTPLRFSLLADSGFPKSHKIRIPAGVSTSDPVIAAIQLQEHRAVTSTRQAAEWGMRVLQGTFQRLHLCLPSNPTLRATILKCVLHLCNLRTRVMGINQIRTVFDPNYTPNVLANKDARRITQYYHV